MKTIIAGGRDVTDYGVVEDAVAAAQEKGFVITEVVSGGASGVDYLGEVYARNHNLPIRRFKADWDRYKKAAGPIRNQEMAVYGESLIAIWDGISRGTKNMIEEANKRGLKVFVYMV